MDDSDPGYPQTSEACFPLHIQKNADIINVFFHNKRKFSVSYLDENNHLKFKTFNGYNININIVLNNNFHLFARIDI